MGIPANASESKTCGLLRCEEQHLNGPFGLEVGFLQAFHSCNGPQHTHSAVIHASMGNGITMRASHHRSCNIMGHTLKHVIKNGLLSVNAAASIHHSSRLATLWLTGKQAEKQAG